MIITAMNVTPVAMADAPLRNAPGIHEPYANRIIVELVGADGQSGWGEGVFSSTLLADLQALAPRIVGMDSWDQPGLHDRVASFIGRHDTAADREDPVLRNFRTSQHKMSMATARTVSPIEVAAFDLSGREAGRPVHELLGGKVRDEVSFSAYLFYKHAGGGGEGDDQRDDEYGEVMSPEAVVREARQMVATHGFRSIKLKAGVLGPDAEIASIRQLRAEFGPSVPLRIDPNCAWTVDTSCRVAHELRGELEYFEDPTATIAGMGEVRRRLLAEGINLPQATNMCVVQFGQIPAALEEQAVQVILGDHHFWGGLRATKELGRICQVFGIGMSMHSNSHLGISLAAMTHLAAATPRLTYDVDTHYPWLRPEDEIIVGGKTRFTDGAIAVSDQPGLGIEVDRDALARQHALFERIRYRDRDDVGYMQRTVDPSWSGSLPRW